MGKVETHRGKGFRKAVNLEILKIIFETVTKYEWLKTQEEKEKSTNN